MGGRGKDSLYGESGDDRLAGDGSADAIYGGVGDDTLDGGAGADQVVGGPGHNLGGPAPNGIPACPSTREACSVSIHVDMKLYCPSYRFALAACLGTTPYANLGWDVYLSDLPAMWAQFSWTGSRNRNVSMTAVNGVPTGRLDGSAPDSSSAAFSVQNAWTLKWPNPSIRWYTPDRPGVAPGQVGGPLYLNFRNGIVGADAYIDGYLFRR
jgi:Ca2+-binding RTX toxin-like protein